MVVLHITPSLSSSLPKALCLSALCLCIFMVMINIIPQSRDIPTWLKRWPLSIENEVFLGYWKLKRVRVNCFSLQQRILSIYDFQKLENVIFVTLESLSKEMKWKKTENKRRSRFWVIGFLSVQLFFESELNALFVLLFFGEFWTCLILFCPFTRMWCQADSLWRWCVRPWIVMFLSN